MGVAERAAHPWSTRAHPFAFIRRRRCAHLAALKLPLCEDCAQLGPARPPNWAGIHYRTLDRQDWHTFQVAIRCTDTVTTPHGKKCVSANRIQSKASLDNPIPEKKKSCLDHDHVTKRSLNSSLVVRFGHANAQSRGISEGKPLRYTALPSFFIATSLPSVLLKTGGEPRPGRPQMGHASDS